MSKPTNPPHGEPGHDCATDIRERFVAEAPLIPDNPFRMLGTAAQRAGGIRRFAEAGESYPVGMPIPEAEGCLGVAQDALKDAMLVIAALAATLGEQMPVDVAQRAEEHFTRIMGVAAMLHAREAALAKRAEKAKDN